MSFVRKLLSKQMRMAPADLDDLIRRAPFRYKVYPIPKRNGAGSRLIAQPSPALKAVQRILTSRVINDLPVSRSATAYRRNTSILKNAKVHAKSKYLLKLDFQNFFPSIRWMDLQPILKRAGFDDEDISVILFSTFRFVGPNRPIALSIGAPSSPLISNAVLYEVDEKVRSVASNARVKYSRYADDITLSGNVLKNVKRVEAQVRRIVSECANPTLRFNDSKRGLSGKGQRRMVSGLIITPDGKVSLGRERKRLIHAATHQAIGGALDALNVERTRGWIAFALSVEPNFVDTLRRKYGDAEIDALLRMKRGEFYQPEEEWDQWELFVRRFA